MGWEKGEGAEKEVLRVPIARGEHVEWIVQVPGMGIPSDAEARLVRAVGCGLP